MIRGYIGLLGEGKTLSMINDSVDFLVPKKKEEFGRRIITNVPFVWKHRGTEYKPIFYEGKQFERALLTEVNALFLIDEASIVFPSYFWNKLSGSYLMRFAQARKYGLDIFFTSQGWNHTIKRLRDLTNIVVKCEKVKVPFYGTIMRNIHYNPDFFMNKIMLSPQMERKYILGRKFITKGRQNKLFKAYDTMFTISASALTTTDTTDYEY